MTERREEEEEGRHLKIFEKGSLETQIRGARTGRERGNVRGRGEGKKSDRGGDKNAAA